MKLSRRGSVGAFPNGAQDITYATSVKHSIHLSERFSVQFLGSVIILQLWRSIVYDRHDAFRKGETEEALDVLACLLGA